MKLGEMQTYEYSHSQGKMMPDPDNAGDYVLYTDASSLLTASEARVKILEDALRIAEANLAGWCDAIDHTGTGWDDWDKWFKDAKYERKGKPSVLSVIRAALGDVTATKGESK